MIVIIDYNVGNLKSVTGAFKRIGLEAVVSRDEKVIREAKGIVLPGVGTFPTAMKNLEKYHLVDLLKERKEAGIPILGICLGWAATGSMMGPIVFAIAMLGYDIIVTHLAIRKGYSMGTNAVTSILEGGLFKKLTTFFSIMGLFVLGVMVCKFITIDIAWVPVIAGEKIVVKDLFDKIIPEALPLAITLVSWQALMRGVKVVYVLLALFVVSLIGGALGIIQ